MLGVTVKPIPRGALAANAGDGSSQQQPLYELVWQVSGIAAPPASPHAGRHQHALSVEDRSAAPASMLALLQAASAHRAFAVDLRSTEQALHAPSQTASSSAALSDGSSGLLRTFAQESPAAAAGSFVADVSAAGSIAGNRVLSLMLGTQKPGRVSNASGSRLQAATQLSAVLLPSTVRHTVGADLV